MPKQLTFDANLVPLVLNGSKTATWRLFDDKDLQAGDVVEFLGRPERKHFATVELTEVFEKSFKDLTEADRAGHETFVSDEDMYAVCSRMYGKPIGPEDVVKVIRFKVLV